MATPPTDRNIPVYCYTDHTGQVAATVLGMLGYDVSNIKYGMMGWTEDNDVLATERFGSEVQRDFRVESAAEMEQPAEEQPAAEQPAELPATGAPVSPMVLAGLVLALSSLGTGLSLRRRLGQKVFGYHREAGD